MLYYIMEYGTVIRYDIICAQLVRAATRPTHIAGVRANRNPGSINVMSYYDEL